MIPLPAHWLAVEGVQPSIPQNPTSADQRHQELLPKGPGANPNLAAIGGNDNVAIKPLVKHVISKELQLYFERICSAILDDTNQEYRLSAFASLRTDPGLHQLLPYFVHYVADKVTHNLKSLFVLRQMMQLLAALLENPSLYIAPYVASLVPPVLTCLNGKHLGSTSADGPEAHFALRDFSASLLSAIAKQYGQTSATLKTRIVRSCLKDLLDSHKPFGTHYGAVLGLRGIAGAAGVRTLILPNLQTYDLVLKQGLADEHKKDQAERVAQVLLESLQLLEQQSPRNTSNGHPEGRELKERLVEAIGEVLGGRVYESGRPGLVSVVLERDMAV
jgi:transcription initiation factor TFIID subunit 6